MSKIHMKWVLIHSLVSQQWFWTISLKSEKRNRIYCVKTIYAYVCKLRQKYTKFGHRYFSYNDCFIFCQMSMKQIKVTYCAFNSYKELKKEQ